MRLCAGLDTTISLVMEVKVGNGDDEAMNLCRPIFRIATDAGALVHADDADATGTLRGLPVRPQQGGGGDKPAHGRP